MSSSRPKRSLPVTGNLAIEIFLGASLAGGFRVPTREAVEGICSSLMSDSTPCSESACYCRQCLQQFVRSLESLCRIFIEEFLEEVYDRLWNTLSLSSGNGAC